ncbi:MAG: hypothetical protein AB1696_07560 [Planctomycetota bacterium]
MAGRWKAFPAAAVGILAGLVTGYCELMIRHHETGMTLGQFPFLLASRGALGGIAGAIVALRGRISLGRALAVAALVVLGLAEVLNRIFFAGG